MFYFKEETELKDLLYQVIIIILGLSSLFILLNISLVRKFNNSSFS